MSRSFLFRGSHGLSTRFRPIGNARLTHSATDTEGRGVSAPAGLVLHNSFVVSRLKMLRTTSWQSGPVPAPALGACCAPRGSTEPLHGGAPGRKPFGRIDVAGRRGVVTAAARAGGPGPADEARGSKLREGRFCAVYRIPAEKGLRRRSQSCLSAPACGVAGLDASECCLRPSSPARNRRRFHAKPAFPSRLING